MHRPGRGPIELPDGRPSGAMVVRWRLGLFVDDRLVGHAGLTAHWAPVWNHVPHELVTYCGVVFRRDHVEVLDGPRGQLCELCLLRVTRGRLPNPALVRWATWRPPRSLRGRRVDRLALQYGCGSRPGVSSR